MGWWTHGARVQRDAVAQIVPRRGKVYHDWEVKFVPLGGFYQPKPSGRPWWPRWVGTRQRLEFNNAHVFVDADLAPLAAMTDLRTLMLPGPGISDAGLVHLRGMAKMHSLALIDNHVTSAGLEHLRSMTLLASLDLDRSRVESLAPIRQLARLRRVLIASTPIADAALTDLKGLDQLEFLDLSETQVTDAGLERLRRLKKLRTLRVRGTAVSSEAIAALRQELPLLVPETPHRSL
jgi:hypothetical protein